MIKQELFSLKSVYREDMQIYGYRFGQGERTACIVGAIRGNEVQQLYICSQLVDTLKTLEAKGAILYNKEIMVIPSVNHYSMNIGRRFWPNDNTDINRMFPGYSLGETTQRIAAGVFDAVKDYQFGVQCASFYMPGDFVPHIRMMETGYHNTSLACMFGFPYVLLRKPKPFDTTLLNYNWQIWNTSAFSLYTNETDRIDEVSAHMAVAAILRFLSRMGVIHYNGHSGYISSVLRDEELKTVKSCAGGIFRRLVNPGDEVTFGQELAEILDPLEGAVTHQILSPTDGVIFFAHNNPLVMENTAVFRIIKRMHV